MTRQTNFSRWAVTAAVVAMAIGIDRLNPDSTLEAMIASFSGDEAPLAALIGELES